MARQKPGGGRFGTARIGSATTAATSPSLASAYSRVRAQAIRHRSRSGTPVVVENP